MLHGFMGDKMALLNSFHTVLGVLQMLPWLVCCMLLQTAKTVTLNSDVVSLCLYCFQECGAYCVSSEWVAKKPITGFVF